MIAISMNTYSVKIAAENVDGELMNTQALSFASSIIAWTDQVKRVYEC